MRDEEPDIDVDFDSDRREEVIQYVFDKYGRENAAQVANVVSYRPKFAVRDMAKAFGASPGQQDAWSKQVERWGALISSEQDHDIPEGVVDLALEVMKFPRHLGIHSGGMVLTDRPVGEVVPIEHARMEKRTVVQWDKDDCAWMGLVKFDLLGLGMLSAIQYTFDLVRDHLGEDWTLATIPREEPGVYDQLCRADSVGVFQVESRAQMGLLPRLQPRKFYDLVVEIALVRPGPIQGGAVHPFVRRKLGYEPITYLHPKLEEPLKRTLGVPIFQEQLMQVAMAVGGCTGDDADLLRRAMGSKRGIERIDSLQDKLYAGMAENGIIGAEADSIYAKIQAFAGFGFAESHALSFGLLVYASAWLRLHYPAAFLASLLRAQPMGFYSPQSLISDARRHGVRVLRPDLQRSLAVVDDRGRTLIRRPSGNDTCARVRAAPDRRFDPAIPFDQSAHTRDGAFAVRLGLAEVSGIGEKLAVKIVEERDRGGAYADMHDLVRRVGLETKQLEVLAAAGAFDCFGLGRREAMWNAGNAAQDRPEYLTGTVVAVQPPLFAMPTKVDELLSDLWSTGRLHRQPPGRARPPGAHRARHPVLGRPARSTEPGRRVEVAGVVTHRQRPATASGITFLNLEDETGLTNVICSVGVWNRYRRVVRDSPALVVRGMLERSPEGVTNLLADGVQPAADGAEDEVPRLPLTLIEERRGARVSKSVPLPQPGPLRRAMPQQRRRLHGATAEPLAGSIHHVLDLGPSGRVVPEADLRALTLQLLAPDAHQPHRPEVGRVVELLRRLVQGAAEVRGVEQCLRPADRREVAVAHLHRDGPCPQLRLAEPHGDHVRETEQLPVHELGGVEVELERALVADALLLALQAHPPRVDAPGEVVQALAGRVADDPGEHVDRGVGEVADRVVPAVAQHLLGLAADAPQRRDRERMQERDRLVARNHQQAVGLGKTRRELRDELRGRRPDRADQTGLFEHAGAQERRHLHRRPEDRPRAGDVEERLVDAEPLDVRGQVVADRHDLVRVVDVAVEVGRQDDGVRASPERDRHRHRRVHPVGAGLVRRRGDHRSRRRMPHDHRLALELRVVEQLDGREERVHVHVQDGRGRVVHRPGGDLPVAPILLAHERILPPRTDRGPILSASIGTVNA